MNKGLLKGFLFFSGVFIPFYLFAYSNGDIIQEFVTIGEGETYTYTIPNGKDLIIKTANVINNNENNVEIDVYDDTKLKYKQIFDKGESFGVYDMYFTGSLVIKNISTGTGSYNTNIYYNGYLIPEDNILKIEHTEDIQDFLIDLGSNKNNKFYILVMIFILWFVFLGLLLGITKTGFKTGFIFIKKKFIGKK